MRQGFPGTFAGHLQQTQCRETVNCRLDAVPRELLLEFSEDSIAMIFSEHVDEIDNHNTAKIAQTKLACDGLGCLQIRLEDRFFKIPCTNKAPGIHIDSRQRLGLVNDE